MTLPNMNIIINNVVKFCYEIQLLWNALNPLKCKCGYNYRANYYDVEQSDRLQCLLQLRRVTDRKFASPLRYAREGLSPPV